MNAVTDMDNMDTICLLYQLGVIDDTDRVIMLPTHDSWKAFIGIMDDANERTRAYLPKGRDGLVHRISLAQHLNGF